MLAKQTSCIVRDEGKIVQLGTPQDIYERPRTKFVADFVGSSNVVGPALVKLCGLAPHWASLRPEKIAVLSPKEKPPRGQKVFDAKVMDRHYQGAVTRFNTELGDGTKINVSANISDSPSHLRLTWPKSALHMMEDEA